MAIRYLDLVTAKSKLIEYGLRTLSTMPSDGILTDLIEEIEDRLIVYLGYAPGIQAWVYEHPSNSHGELLLKQYPVVEVTLVQAYLPSFPSSTTSTPITLYDTVVLWDKTNTIHCGYPDTNLRVEYTAGTDDPDMTSRITRVAWNILQAAIGNTLDSEIPTLSWLDEPTADETNLSLPGGLSHGLQLGKPEGGGTAGSKGISATGTIADRLFDPLSRFRRLYNF